MKKRVFNSHAKTILTLSTCRYSARAIPAKLAERLDNPGIASVSQGQYCTRWRLGCFPKF
jgi:hypothetical protein